MRHHKPTIDKHADTARIEKRKPKAQAPAVATPSDEADAFTPEVKEDVRLVLPAVGPVTTIHIVSEQPKYDPFEGLWISAEVVPDRVDIPVIGWDDKHKTVVMVQFHKWLGQTGGFGTRHFSDMHGISLKFNPHITKWHPIE